MNKFIRSTAGLALLMFTATLLSCDDAEEKIYGLDGAAKYGNINVTFSGTRPDDEPFEVTNNYRFLAENNSQNSYVIPGTTNTFYARREYGAVNLDHEANYISLSLTADSEGPLDANTIGGDTFILTGDNTFINLNFGYNFQASDITSYTYNEDTGKLNLEFSIIVPSESNPTGNALTITVKASVNVFRGNFS